MPLKAKPMPVTLPQQHPFVKAFPTTAAVFAFLAACARVVATLVRWLWPWRRELAGTAALVTLWTVLDAYLPSWAAFVASLGVQGAIVAIPPVRETVWGWLRCAVTRRQILAGLEETRSANPSGKLPIIRSIRVTAVGERVQVVARPGQSAELLDARVEELRAAARCRELRVTRDPNRSHRITFDVVRRDPLANSRDVPWADLDTPVLSMWDPVTVGIDEDGQPVKLSLRERGLLGAGEPGSGKSSMGSVILAHAAKSPDAHLVLIDPNEVQFAPWRDRALAFAASDPVEALDALDLVRGEVSRRLALLRSLPGVVRKVTPDIATEHELPLWVLAIDELAFHTSVAGTDAQRRLFNTYCRDIVARSRAAGVIPVMFTQRPTSDVVPTSLRDLFSVRCAFRTTTKASSDVILGEGWARQGYSATDIDITARGVGWLLAEGQKPKRFKGAWLPDATIADLAVSTLRHRPAPPPEPEPDAELQDLLTSAALKPRTSAAGPAGKAADRAAATAQPPPDPEGRNVMTILAKAVGVARVPARPSVLARWRRPKPHELVQVAIVGHPGAVTAIARQLARVAIITGIRHHVHPHTDAAGRPVIRLEVTCHPTQPIPDGAR